MDRANLLSDKKIPPLSNTCHWVLFTVRPCAIMYIIEQTGTYRHLAI